MLLLDVLLRHHHHDIQNFVGFKGGEVLRVRIFLALILEKLEQ